MLKFLLIFILLPFSCIAQSWSEKEFFVKDSSTNTLKSVSYSIYEDDICRFYRQDTSRYVLVLKNHKVSVLTENSNTLTSVTCTFVDSASTPIRITGFKPFVFNDNRIYFNHYISDKIFNHLASGSLILTVRLEDGTHLDIKIPKF